MRLTRYTDYCCRVLIYVALKGRTLSTTREISLCYGISNNHLMKVVYDLNLKGYLETIRGKNGGIRLRRLPAEINIGSLIRDTEADFRVVDCGIQNPNAADAGESCRIRPACVLRHALHEATAAFLAVLDRYTLADLLRSPGDLMAELSLSPAPPPGPGTRMRTAD
jgi:Rrf2 family nitric oxide-sensitive transcriptional repressor